MVENPEKTSFKSIRLKMATIHYAKQPENVVVLHAKQYEVLRYYSVDFKYGFHHKHFNFINLPHILSKIHQLKSFKIIFKDACEDNFEAYHLI